MSYENLFLINGVTVNENLRGQALQPLHRGRDPGNDDRDRRRVGRVRPLRRRRRQHDHQVGRQPVQRIVPRHAAQRRLAHAGAAADRQTSSPTDTKVDKIVPTYEYTFGGPIIRDRLWFFTAGRFQEQESARQLVDDNIPYIFTQDSKRYEFNGTYSATSNHRVQGDVHQGIARSIEQYFQTRRLRWMSAASRTARRRRICSRSSYSGILTPSFFIEGRYSQRNFSFIGSGSKSTGHHRWHAAPRPARGNRSLLVADLLRRLHA